MRVLPLPRPSSAEQAKAFSPTSVLHFYALQNTITRSSPKPCKTRRYRPPTWASFPPGHAFLSARPYPPFRSSTPSIPSGCGLYPARKTVRQALSEDQIGEKRKARSTSKEEALRACLCSYTFVCRNYPKLSNIRFFIGTPRLSSMPSTALLIGPGPHM